MSPPIVCEDCGAENQHSVELEGQPVCCRQCNSMFTMPVLLIDSLPLDEAPLTAGVNPTSGEWLVKQPGQDVTGPYTPQQLDGWVEEGLITSKTLLKKVSDDAWSISGDVYSELAGAKKKKRKKTKKPPPEMSASGILEWIDGLPLPWRIAFVVVLLFGIPFEYTIVLLYHGTFSIKLILGMTAVGGVGVFQVAAGLFNWEWFLALTKYRNWDYPRIYVGLFGMVIVVMMYAFPFFVGPPG
ncbi:MAG: hypothetical protein N2C14_21600 [Planctomycetales bacterium]